MASFPSRFTSPMSEKPEGRVRPVIEKLARAGSIAHTFDEAALMAGGASR